MVRNDLFESHFAQADAEDRQFLVNAIPGSRIQPSDVSSVMAWLCSDETRYFTGNEVRLDAGASLR